MSLHELDPATLGLIRQAASEIFEKGTFDYAKQQIPDSELCEFFSRCLRNKQG